MRLAHFDFNNNFGGAPQSMVNLARLLARRHDVHIVDAYGMCEPYVRAALAAQLPFHVIMPNARHRYIGHHGIRRLGRAMIQAPELLRLRARLAATIRDINPDVLWIMNEKSLTFVGTCWSLRRIPIAYAVRGWATRDQIGRRLRFLLRHRVAATMAVSTATAEQLLRAGVPEARLHTISSTIDMEAVSHEATLPLSSPLPGTDHSPRLLMMAARPEEAKGHSAALRAVARLVKAGRSPVLWIPGRPPVGSGNGYVDTLRRQCKELGVESNVFFLGWRDDMPQLISASEVCLLPSHTEGLPRSLLEAMLLRRPVIATAVGGIGDAIVDGVTGHLIPVDDDASMAHCIERLAGDLEHRDRIVDAAYDHVRRTFDPEVYTRKVEHVLRLIAPAAA